jgi:hypothetical protein
MSYPTISIRVANVHIVRAKALLLMVTATEQSALIASQTNNHLVKLSHAEKVVLVKVIVSVLTLKNVYTHAAQVVSVTLAHALTAKSV